MTQPDVPAPSDERRNDYGKVTGKQCPECGDYISPRGYYTHALHCAGPAESEGVADGGDETDESEAEDDDTSPRELDLTGADEDDENDGGTEPGFARCPECSSEVHDADDAADALADAGFDAQQVQAVRSHDYYCDNCHVAYTSDEVVA